ncbi:hypothetical protein AAFN47_20335 [Hoeflea sp. CAU 1731]
MANRPTTIRKADIERTVKGVLATGLVIAKVEVEGRKLVIHTADGNEHERPLDQWRRQRGQS